MGKGCLSKLSGNITVDCTIPQMGVKNLYLMHAEDVTLEASGVGHTILGAEFAPDAVVTRVEGYKQNIQVTSAIRTTDASSKLDFRVSFKMPGNTNTSLLHIRSLLNGRFYVLVEYQEAFVDGANALIGYNSPLECSGVDFDSNANAGFTTVTLSAPEGSAGNYAMQAVVAAVKQIKSKVGV